MASYTYLTLQRPITSTDLRTSLEAAVRRTLPEGPWKVVDAPFVDGGPTFLVVLEGMIRTGPFARRPLPGLEGLFGFPVALMNDGLLVGLRHSLNLFERWAQGRVEEILSTNFGAKIYSEDTGKTSKPGRKRYRRGGNSFRGYLACEMKRPISPEDQAYLDQEVLRWAPEGFR